MKLWLFPDGFIGDDPVSKHNARWLAVFSIFAIVVWLLAMWMVYLHAEDGFVRTIEMRVGVAVGQTRTLPECGCTIRYLGTRVRGNVYTIRVQRLD